MAKLAEKKKKKPPAVPTGNAVEDGERHPDSHPRCRGARRRGGPYRRGRARARLLPVRRAQAARRVPRTGVAAPARRRRRPYAGGYYPRVPALRVRGAAAEAAAAASADAARYQRYRLFSSDFSRGRAFAGPLVPGARERARNPWGLPRTCSRASVARTRSRASARLSPSTRARSRRRARRRAGETRRRIQKTPSGPELLARAVTCRCPWRQRRAPRASSGGRDLGELLGLGARVGAEDVLGMYLVARRSRWRGGSSCARSTARCSARGTRSSISSGTTRRTRRRGGADTDADASS